MNKNTTWVPNFETDFYKYLGYKKDGIVYDFHTLPENSCEIELIERESVFGQDILRHSVAHVLAQSLKKLYKNIKFGIGPTTEVGFYYDFITDHPLSSTDFVKIEKEMTKIIKADYQISKTFHSKDEAKKILSDPIKDEIMETIEGQMVSLYSQGDFIDLCKGPHVKSTGCLGYTFKLTNISQILWKKIPMQRIEGIAFSNEEMMKEYQQNEVQKQKNEHRTLGKTLDLFSFSPYSPGMAFWHSKGVKMYRKIEDYLRSIISRDYNEVVTPPMYKLELWQKTGHLDKYRDNMYIIEDMALKPMSCPAHTLMFKMEPRSYRDLPLRLSEFGRVFRNEDQGGVVGLKRAKYFCQDDAHIFCHEEQIKPEIVRILRLIEEVYSHFGLEYLLKISTRPEKLIGSDDLWELAENVLIDSVKSFEKDYLILPGEGAFYGPKIEIHLIDQNKKLWQCGTVQVDFFIGERLDAEYTNENCERKNPIVIHHAILGSLERFIAMLLELGLPFQYNPYQLILIPVSAEKNLDYCHKVKDILHAYNCEILDKHTTLNEKIKKAYELKPGFMIIVGQKEQEANTVTLQYKSKNTIEKLTLPLLDLESFVKNFHKI